jgi:hypothetical protein
VNRPRVAVVMPRYGAVELGAATSYASPCGDGQPFDVVTWMDAGGSMTPHAFNQLWAGALDARDAGELSHLAMIHADVCPRNSWLDTLWREMHAVKADVISAVVAIKSIHRDTSTAIGDADDPWRINRKVRVIDYHGHPTTFTAADVCDPGEALLINTGLMLIDLQRDWWDGFAWQWHTRIGRRDDGTRRAEIRTEDYEMSRYVQANGGTVAATWAVEVDHIGPYRWSNRP